jgi:hypothetical protein
MRRLSTRPGAIALWLALGATFFPPLVVAAYLSPLRYDWEHTVISRLDSPRDNPHTYGIACAALALSGLLLLPFATLLQERTTSYFSRRPARWAAQSLRLGGIGMTGSALLVPGHYRVLGLGRMHEHLAQMAAVSFCLALLFAFAAMMRLVHRRPWVLAVAAVLVLLPVTALVVSRLALWLSWDFAPRAAYEAIKASLWSSLALWEWIGAASTYAFLGLLVIVDLPAQGGRYSVGSSSLDVSSSR